jgi:predicted amidohydrolase
MMKFKVALAQTHPVLFDKGANLQKAEQFIRQAALEKSDIAVFPELHLTGYSLAEHAVEIAEPLDGPSIKLVADMARANRVSVIMGFAEQNGHNGKPFETEVFINREGVILGAYRKMHLWGGESNWFSPGSEPCAIQSDIGLMGMLICYDIEFPETPRILAIRGAQWFAVMTAIMKPYQNLYDTYLKARALENRAWVIEVNRVGKENEIEFFGRSGVCDPFGNIVVQANEEECLIFAEVDLDLNEAAKKADTDYLSDRRPELYFDITKV